MEADRRIRRIAIVGGGFAGWTAAAILSRKLGGHFLIHVVDSADTVTVGVERGHAAHDARAAEFLGADQNGSFIDKTQSTYCLGTRFTDWAAAGQNLLASVRVPEVR